MRCDDTRLVLNAGAGPQRPGRLHAGFRGWPWQEIAIDVDAATRPDRVGSVADMRDLFEDESFDAVWSSHSIEHLRPDEARASVAEFHRVLKPDGFALVTCPDLEAICALLVEHGPDHVAYISPAGPITVHDMIFGHTPSIIEGREAMGHRTGFTCDSLAGVALAAGFAEVRVGQGTLYDLWAVFLMPDTDTNAIRHLLSGSAAAFLLAEGV